MDRIQIINYLIQKNNFKSYLEIGVRNPDDCFNKIICDLKHGVDPGYEGDFKFDFKMTSDEFFNQNDNKYDLIFIDGSHIDYQVEKDIYNSLMSLNDGGFLVLHDCYPPTIYHQREDYGDNSTSAGGYWNGTVWKAFVKVRSELKDIFSCVVDCDWGVGIITKTKNPNPIVNENVYFSYREFEKNVKYYLNLISPNEFENIFYDLNKPQLTWLAKFDDHSSMGILSQKILENLKSVDVSCKSIIGKTETKNNFILNCLNKNSNNEIGIMFSYPDMIGELNTFKTKVIYTGVDTTGGIPNFAQNCNKADFLLTPSEISKQRMIDLGVKKPIFVFPHGIEKNKFPFKQRKKDDKFKFLYVGECSDRKGIFHLVKAFIDLFGYNENVELVLRSNDSMLFYGGEKLKKLIEPYPNIIWNHTNTTHDELCKLYEECHVYVYPSRADTFGMTLLEAMSSGLPIISTKEPGVVELIDGRYDVIHTSSVKVEDHPWMLGNWGEPNQNGLRSKMLWLYENYNTLDWNELENHSEYVNEELNWEKLTQKFETKILPKLKKEIKILTLLTSYERPNHIPNVIESFKQIREYGINNHVYIVENSESNRKEEIVNIINSKIDENFTLYVSEFNMGQRGALLQVLDMVNIDDYDFVQFSDQDNIFKEPLSTYCDILLENQDITFVTGYMSKEHGELGWRQTRFGNLCEKRSLRAGHMFMRVSDIKKLFPLHLDAHYGQPYNSSWNAGLDWELTYWNPNSVGKNSNHNFVLCVPGGVLHVGYDSTIYEWPVEENEYRLEELISMR